MTSHLMIVDDDPLAGEGLAALLAPYGMSLKLVTSGRQAIAHLEKADVDLVIADLLMPDMDGLELCRRIKAHPSWRFIPVIIVSALDDESDMVHGFEAGADEYLTKPVSKFILRARVRVMLRIREHYLELLSRAQTSSIERLIQRRFDELAKAVHISKREREVLDLLMLGRSTEEIGIALDISARTAKFHQANVLKKLGVVSRHELMRVLL